MKKIAISVCFIAVFVAYAIYSKFSNKNSANILSLSNQSDKNTTQSNTTASLYKDGSYIGDSVDAYYGNMQVKAIIMNGSLSDIQFLVFPNKVDHSLKISNTSLPQLKTEAIAAQNANIDIVSGATQTSEGFKQSLFSALAQAH